MIVGVALVVAWLFRHAMLDDAYITYRVAANYAGGHGLVYNVSERTLTTTAPGYALLLAPLALTGDPFLTLALLLSALALACAAWLLSALGGGLVGAILLLSSPLLLGALGMETTTQVALVLLGVLWAQRNRPVVMALALAAATLVRPDGAVPALLIAIAYLCWWRRLPLAALPAGILPVAVLYGWLWYAFGSPLPVTLAAKVAQRSLGFYGYLEGMRVWAGEMQALIPVSPWWLVPVAVLIAVGLAVSLCRPYRWNLVLLAWAAVHSAVYVGLGVAGYSWYYAPIALAVASTLGVCVQWSLRRDSGWWRPFSHKAAGITHAAGATAPWRRVLAAVIVLTATAVVVIQVRVSAAIVASLPEPRGVLYQQAGRWLAANTQANATVGVMEVGIMGYYAHRTMIDFAGLTRPATAEALARGDIFWSIAHYQPDYLVLSNTDPLYSYDIQDDPWFQATYQSVTGFRDTRWYGSPLTIFQRRAVPPDDPVAEAVGARYGTAVRLKRVQLDRTVARPGQFIHLAATWTRDGPVPGTWKLFAHVIDDTYRVYGGDDIAVAPDRWPLGVDAETNQFVAVPAGLAAGRYYLEIGWYDPATLKRLPVTDATGKPAGETVVLHAITVER